MELPKEFLKKWIQQNSEKPVTLEQIEADFENYEKGLKWQLIESKIVKDNDIKVEFEDIKAKALELINANMAQYGQPALDGEQAEEAIKSVLTNQEEARRINDMLYEDKVVEVIEAAVKIEEEDISYNDFLKLVTDKK
jgi:trigger factor